MAEMTEWPRGDIDFMEQLMSLKEINNQQRLLSRAEGLVDRSFEAFQKCGDQHRRCKKEIELLKEQRRKLMDRVVQIDNDIHELSDIADSLETECSLQCSSSTFREYHDLLQRVNSLRSIGQLAPFTACAAYSELERYQTRYCSAAVVSQKDQKVPPNLTHTSTKAGRSFKQCPSCLEQVSRNAVHCPHCKSICSKKTKL